MLKVDQLARIHDTVWYLNLKDPLYDVVGNISILQSSAAPIYKDCIYISATSSTWHDAKMIYLKNLNMICGKHMTFRFFYKTSALVADTKFFIDFTSPTTTATYVTISVPNGTSDWTEFSQEILVPHDATISRLRIVASPSTGQCWLNGIRFTSILHNKARPSIDPTFNPPGFNMRGFYMPSQFRDTSGAYQRLRTNWNTNVVRFGLEYNEGFDLEITDLDNAQQYDAWMLDKLSKLDLSINYARNNNIKIILDMHTMLGGNNRYPKSNLIVEYNGLSYDRYIYWWKYIANKYKGNDTFHAFDLMNEPADAWWPRSHGPSEKTWWDCQVDAAREIRKIDPTRTLIFETNNYASCYRFDGLDKFPFDNCYPSVHIYEPGEFTANDSTLVYPGLLVNGEVVNKAFFYKILQPLRDYQLAYKYPSVFVGEFATHRWKNSTAQWLRDLIDIFDEWNWVWSYFGYCDADQYGSQGWAAIDLQLDNRQDIDIIANPPSDRALVVSASMTQNTNPYL